MVDTNLTTPSGTIAGWDTITLSDESVVVEGQISAEQLYAYLKGIVTVVDPRRLRGIEQLILSHIQDTNNPHKDTIAMLGDDFVAQILARVTPGTSPAQYPSLAFIADMELPDDITVISVARDSEMITLDRQGYFTTAPANQSGVDWSTGRAIIPLFPEVKQSIPVTDTTLTKNLTITGLTSAAAASSATLLSPNKDTKYLVLYETGDTSEHVFTITSPVNAQEENTTSFFLYPHNAAGILVFVLRMNADTADTTKFVTVDLTTRAVSVTGDGEYQAHLEILPNGWWRIGIQYVASADGVMYVDVAHTLDGVPNSTYTGTSGNPLFSIFTINTTNTPGFGPILLDDITTLAPSTLTMPISGSPSVANRGMYSINFSRALTLLSGTTGEKLFDNGVGISAAYTGNTLTVSDICGTQPLVTNMELASEESIVAMSFSPTEFMTKATGFTKSKYGGSFTPNGTITAFTFGPFYGGLSQFSSYGVSDDNRALEFLVGEN